MFSEEKGHTMSVHHFRSNMRRAKKPTRSHLNSSKRCTRHGVRSPIKKQEEKK